MAAVITRLALPAMRSSAALAQRRALSTTRRMASAPNSKGTNPGPNPSPNPSVGEFSFKNITSNPRTRRFLIGAFVVLACIEGVGWWNFAPKIFGGRGAEPDQPAEE